MIQLLQFTLNVCRLRDGPQNAPVSQSWLALLAFFYLILVTSAYAKLSTTIPPVLPAIQSLIIGMLVLWLLLRVKNHAARFVQTAITLLATSCVVNLVDTGLDRLVTASGESTPGILVICWLALFLWSFVIDAHIYRHALQTHFTQGMLISVSLFALNQFLLIGWYLPQVQTS